MIIGCVIILSLGLLAFLFYASYSIRSGIYVKAICRIPTTERKVLLTFDDGPHARQTPQILDILRRHECKAAFFCIGRNLQACPDIAARIVAEGHVLGNHSWGHEPWFPLLTVRNMTDEMTATDGLITEHTQQPVRWFRPPFGVTNPRIAKAVRTRGYQVLGWSIRTLDTCTPNLDLVLARIEKRLHPGAVILLHDRLPQSHLLLPRLLELLKRRGYAVMDPAELL